MTVTVQLTHEFRDWWKALSRRHQNSCLHVIGALRERGVRLQYPHSSKVHGSRHSHMRELRVQTRPPIRIFYAFDPRRAAILLVGGYKTGERFYRDHVRSADSLYDQHLRELGRDPQRHEGPTR